MKNLPILPFLLLAFIIACGTDDTEPDPVEVDEFKWLKFINVDPKSDTLILIEDFEDRTLAVTGTFIEKKQDTVIVKGLLGETLKAIATNDTTYLIIANDKLRWTSSDNSVATVSEDGVVSPVSTGVARISSSVRGIRSNEVLVKVVGRPFLELSPPTTLTISLPDSAEITGRVEPGALLFVDNNPVGYDVLGRFSYTVVAAALGQQSVEVVAIDKNYPQAVTVKTKTINFVLPPNPLLEIDNPDDEFIFAELTSTISGRVEVGALLYIGGIETDYNADGVFSEVVQLPATGDTTVQVVAVNKLFPDVFTVKSKTYTRTVSKPSLMIDYRSEVTVTSKETIIISGKVQLGALLYVDGVEVPYNRGGFFDQTVRLKAMGENVVEVKAVNPNNPEAFTLKTKTYIKSIQDPLLIIDNPGDEAVFFATSTKISGRVEVGSLLYINGNEVNYNAAGLFEKTIQLPPSGDKVVEVRAVNARYPEYVTEKTKRYTVYPAEDIVGNWSGTVDDGSTFQLTLLEDPANPGNYVFTGLFNWKVVSFLTVVITDLPFSGTLDSNGAIRGAFSASRDGAVADVVYIGSLNSSSDATGTVSYDGTYSPFSVDRTNNWTATKD